MARAFGEPVINAAGDSRYILHGLPTFTLTDLQTVDASATFDWEWTYENNGKKPGIYLVSSASGTFSTDILAHAKILAVLADQHLEPDYVTPTTAAEGIPRGSLNAGEDDDE